MNAITIALDAMSGDHGLKVVIPAAIQAIHQYPDLNLILVGDSAQIRAECHHQKKPIDWNRCTIYSTSQTVEMDESPTQALRYKKDSSMRKAIDLVKQGTAQACVSAGNTGALMAMAHFVLKPLQGIDRSAIIGPIPSNNPHKKVRLLDLGANVDSSAEQLVQFAIMGSVLTSALDQNPQPKIALLNIGEESIKGNEQVRKTSRLLSQNDVVHYIGFVEGDDIFNGEADVIVCDGFVGNVTLKTIEGLAQFIGQLIKQSFQRNLITQLSTLGASHVLKSLFQKIDPSLHNGASFVGLRSSVIKSHGNSTIRGFQHAIELARLEVHHKVPQLIEDKVSQLLKQLGNSS